MWVTTERSHRLVQTPFKRAKKFNYKPGASIIWSPALHYGCPKVSNIPYQQRSICDGGASNIIKVVNELVLAFLYLTFSVRCRLESFLETRISLLLRTCSLSAGAMVLVRFLRILDPSMERPCCWIFV